MLEFPGPELIVVNGTIAIMVTTIVFLVYHSIATSNRIIFRLERNFNREEVSIRKILWYRLSGAILFGLIPILVILIVFRIPLSNLGTNTDQMIKSLIWWIPSAVLVVIINYFAARKKSHLSQYPQIRAKRWDSGLVILSALSWITYLVGYEFLFRGFLLFSCLESFGYWPAIVINISLYSLAHLPKGTRETVASVFFGFVLSYVSIELGSFWFAFFVHITLALSNEWFSIFFHPEMMRVKKQVPR